MKKEHENSGRFSNIKDLPKNTIANERKPMSMNKDQLKINVQTDCGHSPKRAFLRDFNIAFGKGDAAFVIDQVTDDIVWNIVGEQTIAGKDQFSDALNDMKKAEVIEITIAKVITHGKEGAVNGIMKMKNGKEYAFSDFYDFKNTTGTTIKTITSYVIGI